MRHAKRSMRGGFVTEKQSVTKTANQAQFSVRIDYRGTGLALAPRAQQGNQVVELHRARGIEVFGTAVARPKC